MFRVIYVVLDGLGDLPVPDLGNLTPLEAARTDQMDSLAKRGQVGLMHTVGEGIAPESDVAVISILGYDPVKYYTGRGPLESYAAGIEVKEGDLAYRVNFATAGKGKTIQDRRAGRSLTTEEAGELADALNSQLKLDEGEADFTFKNTVGHRGVLVIYLREGSFSAEVTNTDPAYGREGSFGVALEKFENVVQQCMPLPGEENNAAAVRAAGVTNEFVRKSRSLLEEHPVNKKRRGSGKPPANLILTRDGGDRLPEFPPLSEVCGLRFGCFVEMPVERGIALLTEMEIIPLPLPSGDLSADYRLRAEEVVKAAERFPGLYIHIKGPDEPGHDGNAAAKRDVVEKIDQDFFAPLLARIDLEDTVIAVTADHSTPCLRKAHSADPVPLLIAAPGLAPDGQDSFGEKECRQGKLGSIKGPELMPLLAKLAKPVGRP